jgi:hypothetical protein
MSYLPRAMTSQELSLIRTDVQSSLLYLAIHNPTTVYTALVNQAFTSDDSVVQVIYDTGVGTLADILPGMTLWVGTAAGLCDIGQARIRKTPTSTIFYLGECSELLWSDNLFLTVKDEFGVWPRHIKIGAANVAYMDFDVAYSDQHVNCSPIPCLGPRLVPAWMNHTNILYSDASIVYTGSWTAYGGFEKYSGTASDHADFSFTGNRIVFNGVKSSNSGEADFYLDGMLVATVDLYTSGSYFIDPGEYDSGIIAQGTHTFKVVVKGVKNPSSGGYYVAVNSIDVYSTAGGADAQIPFDASGSHVIGSSISAYLWSVTGPGSPSISGTSTATPTLTCGAAGLYRMSCLLTAANGKTETGHVYVQVFDYSANLPINQFDLKSCTGSRSDEGWSFDVTMYAQADFSLVVDRAMVCLFARDFYGDAEVSLGPISGRENIVVEGWIQGESIVEDPDGNSITFTVKGAGPWLKLLTGFPVGIQNVTVAPSRWTDWQFLTVDDSLYQLFYWQSTIIPAVDVFLTGDTKISEAQTAPGDTTVADQLTYLLKNTLLGDACSDRFGRLFCEVDEQLTPVTERSTIPSVLTLEYYDWRDQMPITRIPTPVTSQVNLSGVVINPPNTPKAYFSLAPGHVFQRWGAPKSQDKLLLIDQAHSNELAAMMVAWDNHQLEFQPDLAGNNRMVDIVPHQFVSLDVASSDTPREFTYSGHLIIRQIDLSFEKSTKDDSNFLQASWQAECETFPGPSATGDSPIPGPPNPPPPVPIPPPIIIPVNPAGAPSTVAIWVKGVGLFYTQNANALLAADVQWFAGNDGLDATDILWVTDFLCNPLTGACWLAVDGYNRTGNYIYYSPALGAPWYVVMTQTAAAALTSAPNARVGALGINPGASDEVMAIIGEGPGAGSHGLYWCHGSSGGFTLGALVSAAGGNGNIWGQMVYGSNRWVALISNGFVSYITWCDIGGGAPDYNLTELYMGGAGDIVSMAHAGVDGPVWYAKPCYKTNFDVNIIKTGDNGAGFSDIGAASFLVAASEGQLDDALGVSPDGTYLMAADAAGFQAHRSSDGGTSWGTVGIGGGTAFCCYGLNNLWVGVFGTFVRYTLDGGDIWYDITGDLQTWLGGVGWFTEFLRAWQAAAA